jgi:hypothetical protein
MAQKNATVRLSHWQLCGPRNTSAKFRASNTQRGRHTLGRMNESFDALRAVGVQRLLLETLEELNQRKPVSCLESADWKPAPKTKLYDDAAKSSPFLPALRYHFQMRR